MTTCITAIFILLEAKFSIKNEVDGFETVFPVLSGLKLNSFVISMDFLQALIVFSTHIWFRQISGQNFNFNSNLLLMLLSWIWLTSFNLLVYKLLRFVELSFVYLIVTTINVILREWKFTTKMMN